MSAVVHQPEFEGAPSMSSFAITPRMHSRWTWRLSLACGLSAALLSGSAASYYLDCDAGQDANDGVSPATAWRTIDRMNRMVYRPGDRLCLKRGCAWHGAGFKASGNGSPGNPIVLTDYGSAALPLPLLDGVGPHE